jgi:hypothetical protein
VVLIVGRNALLREWEALQVLLFLKSQKMRLLSNPRLWGEQVPLRMRIAPCNAFSSAVVCGSPRSAGAGTVFATELRCNIVTAVHVHGLLILPYSPPKLVCTYPIQ